MSSVSEESVKDFFVQRGGKVTADELTAAFQHFIHDPLEKEKNRETFKKIVNKIAKQQKSSAASPESEKILVLRDKYRREAGLLKDADADGLQVSILKALSLNVPEEKEEGIFGATDLLTPSRKIPEEWNREQPPPISLLAEIEAVCPKDVGSNDAVLPTEGDSGCFQQVVETVERDLPFTDSSAILSPEDIPFSPVFETPAAIEVVLQEKEELDPEAPVVPKSLFNAPPPRIEHSEANTPTSPAEEKETTFREPEIPKIQTKLTEKEREDIFNRFNAQIDHRHSQLSNKTKQKQAEYRDRYSDTSSWSSASLNDAERKWLKLCASCNMSDMAKVLPGQPELASSADFVSGYAAVHWAAKTGHLKLVQLLTEEYGVDLNKRTGYTPLHLAYMHGHPDVVNFLITHGAKEKIRDNSGKFPSHYRNNAQSTRRVTAAEVFALARSDPVRASTCKTEPHVNVVGMEEHKRRLGSARGDGGDGTNRNTSPLRSLTRRVSTHSTDWDWNESPSGGRKKHESSTLKGSRSPLTRLGTHMKTKTKRKGPQRSESFKTL